MQLFYLPALQEQENNIVFSKEESKHIVRVLRKKNGDQLQATNGKGILFKLQITQAAENYCEAKVEAITHQQPRSYKLHLAVAPTKMLDRYEWFLEKVTEIGVDEITPVICDHSERTALKIERLEKIIVAAMKQSLASYLPIINEPVSLTKWLAHQHGDTKLIAHCGPGKQQPMQRVVEKNTSVLILIGPEGDFSSKEIKLAQENGFTPITLGEGRLRTETAAVVACQNVAFINQL